MVRRPFRTEARLRQQRNTMKLKPRMILMALENFSMGREIAQVMGPGVIEWFDRTQRDTEKHPAQGPRCATDPPK
jgi:hypothetical protein